MNNYQWQDITVRYVNGKLLDEPEAEMWMLDVGGNFAYELQQGATRMYIICGEDGQWFGTLFNLKFRDVSNIFLGTSDREEAKAKMVELYETKYTMKNSL